MSQGSPDFSQPNSRRAEQPHRPQHVVHGLDEREGNLLYAGLGEQRAVVLHQVEQVRVELQQRVPQRVTSGGRQGVL